MIDRYQTLEMKELWSEDTKFKTWLEVEVLACEARAELGEISKSEAAEIRKKASFNIDKILELEEKLQHDVIAFLTNMAEYIGPASRHVHYGMTSSDLLDTSLSVLMVKAINILNETMDELMTAVVQLAKKHKYSICIGRTHGIHAEPTTFGLKMALFYEELKRSKRRLLLAREIVAIGQISGPVGTHSNLDMRVEQMVCQKLGLRAAPISTQILQRDRHAEYLTHLALIASTLEKYATEFRNLQRTEILEVEEGFGKGQKGSSAMPHKKNPITSERIVGLARIIRSNSIAGMENVALWHERDITHSSAERIIIPDSTTLLHYILKKMLQVVKGLNVFPEKMLHNLNLSHGLYCSGRVLLRLTEKGMSREDAYEIIQRNAMTSWNTQQSYKELLKQDNLLKGILTAQDFDELFDNQYFLKNVDHIFERIGLGDIHD